MKLYKISTTVIIILFTLSGCGGTTPISASTLVTPTVEINITGTDVSVVTVETVSQPNCGGTAEVESNIEKSRSIQYVIETQNGIAVNANGQVGFAGTDVELGATIASQLGYSYGTVDNIARSLTVKAKPGTNMQHSIKQNEIWQVGTANIIVGSQDTTIPFRFRYDFNIELIDSKDLGCNNLQPILSPTPPTATIIFEDTFVDNLKNWVISSSYPYIGAGKYNFLVECPANYSADFCGTHVKVPFVFPANFHMEIDLTVLESSTNAKVGLGFQVRKNKDNLYYINYFITDLYYLLRSAYNTKDIPIIPKTSTDLIENELGSTNRFGIEVQDSKFTPIINGYRLSQGEDWNLKNAGDSYLVIYISRGHSAMLQFDNIVVQEVK